MPDNFRPVDAPDVLTTFAGFSEMMDRMHQGPVIDHHQGATIRAKPVVQPAKRHAVRDAQIVEDWRAGKTSGEIGAKWGLTQSGAYFIIRRDIPPRERAQIGANHRAVSGARSINLRPRKRREDANAQ